MEYPPEEPDNRRNPICDKWDLKTKFMLRCGAHVQTSKVEEKGEVEERRGEEISFWAIKEKGEKENKVEMD